MKLYLILIIAFFHLNLTYSQVLNFQLIKNCTQYTKYELSDKLNEIGFSLLNNNFSKKRCSKIYQKGQYFTNHPKRDHYGEISFIVYKDKDELIIEIDYSSNFENWKNILSNIENNFKLEKKFYSPKYKCQVLKYSYNNIFYYAFVDQEDEEINYPGFLISNIRLDECYFSYN